MPPRPGSKWGSARGAGVALGAGRGAGSATRGGTPSQSPAPRPGPHIVGRGIQSAEQGHQLAGSPAAHVTTVGVKRPAAPGKAGRKVTIQTNACTPDMPQGIIYHYDTIIHEKTLPPRFNLQLIKELQLRPEFEPAGAYDGKKNLFMCHRIVFPGGADSSEIDIPMNGTNQQRNRPPKIYKIRITKVAEINLEVLQRFVKGKQSQDEQVLTALTALNVIIRMEPIQRYPFNVRSFFTAEGRQPIGRGFELWRGYFQSVRPTIDRLVINVDISTGMFFREAPLITVALEVIGKYEPSALSPQGPPSRRLSDRDRKQLDRFFSGVRVSVASAAGAQERIVAIQSLTRDGANQCDFTLRDNTTTTVADYFRRQSSTPLRFPSIICIKTGSGAMIPLERCNVVRGQIARKQVPPDLTKKVVEFSTKRPSDRLSSIKDGFQVLAYGQSEYIRNFGFRAREDSFPTRVEARVLPAPVLKYGEGSKGLSTTPRNGAWNMNDKKFVNPMTIFRWAVVVYESVGRFTNDIANRVIHDFIGVCRKLGIQVDESDPLISYKNSQGDIAEHLKAAGLACVEKHNRAGPPSMLLVILPDNSGDIYHAVKHFGDCSEPGVATQCLRASVCNRAKEQYWANVCLKVNVKLGGTNVVFDASTASFLYDAQNPTIIMGADAMHAPPGSDKPSFTSVVGSVDSRAVRYISRINVQRSRHEIIEDLRVMAKELLTEYVGYQQNAEKKSLEDGKPKRLIFYRDGVSEGQFQQVMDSEVAILKDVCKELGIRAKITFIVVGKRHHYRFFPTSNKESEADKSGNCLAGTVVDKGITHPVEFDFYLQSHGGLLGTSRSAHYSVLYDDNSFSFDAIQALSYSLCYIYARSTRSVSIPAPVYYADIICSRARNHLNPASALNLTDTASTTGTSSDDLEAYKKEFKPPNRLMSRRMYFM